MPCQCTAADHHLTHNQATGPDWALYFMYIVVIIQAFVDVLVTAKLKKGALEGWGLINGFTKIPLVVLSFFFGLVYQSSLFWGITFLEFAWIDAGIVVVLVAACEKIETE